MTRLPVEDRNVKARPDLPAYELNTVCCASPYKAEQAGEDLEAHHLWRRSFGKDFREAWWVELADGTVVPNRVGLSPYAHRMVTENKARIIYDAGYFYWVDQFGTELLDPQPGPPREGEGDPTTVADHGSPSPGSECPSCHRRIPHPKKPTSPQTKTFSYRVPMDDVETHTEILEAAARHLGVYEQPHWRYWLATKSAAVVLQTAGEEL